MASTRKHRWPKKGAASIPDGSAVERYIVTLSTAAGLLILFAVYSWVTSALSPSRKTSAGGSAVHSSPQPKGHDRSVEMAEQFLAHAPWAASAHFQVQSVDGAGFFYFQYWTPDETEKVVEFKPFAMIWRTKNSKPEDAPYTVVSESAYVTFESKFSFPGGNPGRIVQAGLEGDVHIEGANDLKVWGRNFGFKREAMRVFSDNHLRFQTDRHSGTAEGVQIEMIADEKAKKDEALAIDGISSVKLLKHVHLLLVADSSQQAGIVGGKTNSNRPQPVDVRSDGSFNFVFASHTATLERNVRIVRESAPGKFDALTSDDSVEIVFDVKTPAKPAVKIPTVNVPPEAQAAAEAKKPTEARPGGFDPNLEFKSLHARGKDVSLKSDANALKATMRDLTYDKAAREARLSAAPDRVVVHQSASRLRTPEIRLIHNDNSEITHVWCRGVGDMEHYDDSTKELDLSAEWHKEMRKYPDSKSPFDIVDLDEAIIEQPRDLSGIAADYIRIWLRRQRREQRTARPNRPPERRNDDAPPIDHMLAWQNVAMVSPDFEAETEHLEVWFEAAPRAPRKTGFLAPRNRSQLLQTSKRIVRAPASSATQSVFDVAPEKKPSAAGRAASNRAPSSHAETKAAGESRPSTPPRSKNGAGPKRSAQASPNMLGIASSKTEGEIAEPYRMTAAVIQVRVVHGTGGAQSRVAEVLSKGNVKLIQSHANGDEPLRIEGNELQMENRGETDQDMVIFGQPAHVRDRGAHVEGGHILFNRSRNTADVQGPGKLQLPVKQTGDGRQLEHALPLDVEWREKMNFDGKTARFIGTVRSRLNDGQAQSLIHCRDLSVVLKNRFSFTQERTKDEQPEIETIFCDGGVEFESDSTLNDRLTELRRGEFLKLTIHRGTGKAEAKGPGLLRVWRHSESGGSTIPQFTRVQSNKPPKNRNAAAWEYIQIAFAGRMEGDFSQMTSPPPQNVQQAAATKTVFGTAGAWASTFYDNVEVLYGRVDQPMETVSRDELLESSGWLGCHMLEIMQHPRTKSLDEHVTLLARRNSQIEGKGFRGEADVISYDGSTGLYVLRGENNRHALLWRQLKIGDEPNRSKSTSIMFNPETGTLISDKTTGLDGLQ